MSEVTKLKSKAVSITESGLILCEDGSIYHTVHTHTETGEITKTVAPLVGVESIAQSKGRHDGKTLTEEATMRAMTYVAHATLHMYDTGYVINETTTLYDFIDGNPAVVVRVQEEILNVFGVVITSRCLNQAIKSYILTRIKPQDVHTTKAYKL